jgi:hypothetical protein
MTTRLQQSTAAMALCVILIFAGKKKLNELKAHTITVKKKEC